MDLCDYKQMQVLLHNAGFHFSKSKGQNFLTEKWVPTRIAEACDLDTSVGVVEIGTGVGCLTEQLAQRAGKVLAFEVDEQLKPVLDITLAPYNNIEIIFDDIMKKDLAAELEASLHGMKHVLCANLPYSITTPLLTKIYRSSCFSSVVVMVQREVADRMCAVPGSKEYGAFTLLTDWYAVPEMLFTVGPECFFPKPKVTSAVVRLSMRGSPPADCDENTFFRVVRAAFNMRRKTLVNALNSVCGKEAAREAVISCGLSDTVRGETLSLADFAAISNAIR